MRREIRLELLLGCRVADSRGEPLGRIEEFEAEGDAILAVLTGTAALLERIWGLKRLASRPHAGRRIRWDQLNWGNPGSLTTNCPASEIEPL